MNQTKSALQKPRKGKTKGRYKLAIFFINHQIPSGKACYHFSTPKQDLAGRSINRFKYLINGGYAAYENKVDWAAIYDGETMIWEYKDHNEDNNRTWKSI